MLEISLIHLANAITRTRYRVRMTDNNSNENKKNTGIIQTRLGLSSNINLDKPRPKLNIQQQIGIRSNNQSASVIVIKKAKSATHGDSSAFSSLTKEEQEKKLLLLKVAKAQQAAHMEDSPSAETTEHVVEQTLYNKDRNEASHVIATSQASLIEEEDIVIDNNDAEELHEATEALVQEEPLVAKPTLVANRYIKKVNTVDLIDFQHTPNKMRDLSRRYIAQEKKEEVVVVAPPVAVPPIDVGSISIKKKSLKDVEFPEEKDNVVSSPKKQLTPELRRLQRQGNKGALMQFALTKDDDMDEEDTVHVQKSRASIRKSRNKKNKGVHAQSKVYREVILPEVISIHDLANRMAEKTNNVIKCLVKLGITATINDSLGIDEAELVVLEFGHKAKRMTDKEFETSILHLDKKHKESPEDMQEKPAVVTIMGHVDHGKTSLLDALRSTDVAAREAGGITQHIGAYDVELANGKHITFLDTPGHEAFTIMRMRGATITDIVVLVVAADDGIKEQTIEAIRHAKAASVPIIVAVNKMDKPDANLERVKNELLSHDLVSEDMGGDVMVIPVSAKNKAGLDKLEEAILLQAEFMSLSANRNTLASGAVIEAKVSKNRGVLATVLVQRGTLKVGDIVVVGTSSGKVKALVDDKGRFVKSACPASPVEMLGLDQVPMAGEKFLVVENDHMGKELVNFRLQQAKDQRMQNFQKEDASDIFAKAIFENNQKVLTVIVKGDVHGSVEAISSSLAKITHDEVTVKVLLSGVGGIAESDVALAAASKAIVLGFNVRANAQATALAAQNGVVIKYYSVIYNLLDDVRAILSGLLTPITKEKITGNAEIKEVFDLSRSGKVAGCSMSDGVLHRNSLIRLLRNNVVIHEGKLKALKRFKEDVKEVKVGFEFGLSLEKYDDIRVGDKIEAFSVTEESRQI